MQRTFHKTFEMVFDACKKAVQKLNFKVEYLDKTKGIIGISSKGSLWSWGELIDIRVKKKDGSSCIVEVRSNSRAQLIDWGKNDENESEILEKLEDMLSR